MKQLILAKGICSVSYLSKLENNQIMPSKEILSLLLQRLSLTINEVNDEEEIYILQTLKAIYKSAVIERNKDIIAKDICEYEKKKYVFKNHTYTFDFFLMIIRLRIITGQELYKVESLLEYMGVHEAELTNYQKCVLYINKALFAFYTKEFADAVEFIEQALNYHQTAVMEKWELADLYNIVAICYLVMNYNYSAIEFAHKSLNIFRDLLIYNRAIDCHITIGISYKRNYKYSESEEHFKVAQLLIKDRGLLEFEGIINQNLGTLYSVQQDSEKAISHFLLSLNSQKTIEGYLLTILSIVQEYSKINSTKNVVNWSQKGIDLQSSESKKNLAYMHHFKTFKAKYDNENEFSKLLIKAIKFFEEKKDYRHVNKYSALLAEYYYDNKKLKNAGFYYRKANEAMLLSRKINKWEDL